MNKKRNNFLNTYEYFLDKKNSPPWHNLRSRSKQMDQNIYLTSNNRAKIFDIEPTNKGSLLTTP